MLKACKAMLFVALVSGSVWFGYSSVKGMLTNPLDSDQNLVEQASSAVEESGLKFLLSQVREQKGPDHPSNILLLRELAELYESQGRYSEAETVLNQALTLAEDHPTDSRLIHILTALGNLHRNQGNFAPSQPYYQQALSLAKTRWGTADTDVIWRIHDLGFVYHMQDQFPEAQAQYEEAIALYGSTVGLTHPEAYWPQYNLGLIYNHNERYADAEPYLLRALTIRKTNQDELPPKDQFDKLSDPMTALVTSYRFQKKFDVAEKTVLELLGIAQKAYGPESEAALLVETDLADVYLEWGKLDQADEKIAWVLETFQNHHGPPSETYFYVLLQQAIIREKQGQLTDAIALVEEAITLQEDQDVSGLQLKRSYQLAVQFHQQARQWDAANTYKQQLAALSQHPL